MSGHYLPAPLGSTAPQLGFEGNQPPNVSLVIPSHSQIQRATSSAIHSASPTSSSRYPHSAGTPTRSQKHQFHGGRASLPSISLYDEHSRMDGGDPTRYQNTMNIHQSPQQHMSPHSFAPSHHLQQEPPPLPHYHQAPHIHAHQPRLEGQRQRQLPPRHHPAQAPSQHHGTQAPISYTRTGRISKAKKGKKVHECKECGKWYSRAEHLRRHQQNHSSSPLKCNFQGCGKTFHRQDLLDRHRERHDDPDGGHDSASASGDSPGSATEYYPGTTDVSRASLPSVSSTEVASTVTEVTQATDYSARLTEQPGTMPAPSKASQYGSVPSGRPHLITMVTSDGVGGVPGAVWEEPMSASQAYSSPSEFSPSREYPSVGFEQNYRPRIWSEPSVAESSWHAYPQISRSPQSASPAISSYWSDPQHKQTNPTVSIPPDMTSGPYASRTSFAHANPDTFSMMSYQFPVLRSYSDRDRDESLVLFGPPPAGTSLSQSQQTRYIDLYMRHFHPMYPVVHGSTINMQEDSPLLKAAMIALGAQFSEDTTDKEVARSLHDRCLRLLSRREQDIAQPQRLCDEQAIFLTEAFKQFRGRRSPQQLSKPFNEMYHSLASDPDLINPSALHSIESQSLNAGLMAGDPVLYQHWTTWNRLATRQRLLLASFNLEMQHAALLARPSEIFEPHTSGLQLPFPASANLYEAQTPEQWASVIRQQPPTQPSFVYEILQELPHVRQAVPYDAFQSSVLIAANLALSLSSDATNGARQVGGNSSDDDNQLPAQILDPTTATQLAHFTALLIRQIPLRAILAITGETWVLSEKLSQESYTSAKAELEGWLNPTSSTTPTTPAALGTAGRLQNALQTSLHIVNLAVQSPNCAEWGPPGSEMGVYFASLVLWTVVTHSQSPSGSPSTSHVRPISPPVTGNSIPNVGMPTDRTHDVSVAHPLALRFGLYTPMDCDMDKLRETVKAFACSPDNAIFTLIGMLGSNSGSIELQAQLEWRRANVAALLAWLRISLKAIWPGTFGELMNGLVRVLEGLLPRQAHQPLGPPPQRVN